MNNKTWKSKALWLSLIVAVLATYSMSVLANPPKLAGEITVSGQALGAKTSVKVNGTQIENGSSIFSSSTISTLNSDEAVINVGKIGRVQLAPNSTLKLTFDETSFTGILSEGKVTVLSASKSENIATTFSVENAGQVKLSPNTSATLNKGSNGLAIDLVAGEITSLNSTGNIVVNTSKGNTVALKTGETVNAQDDDDNEGGAAWLVWALIFGGAIAGIIIAANTDNNRIDLGGNGVVVSPTQ
ncbi:MAG: hypothetical protein HKN25_09590 [Pyrinomonadaceae bacterium]|nr:hypothetical protein [Pyrinomonadaceae bacterium]